MTGDENSDQTEGAPPLVLAADGSSPAAGRWDLFDGLTIGRSNENDVTLNDPLVSKNHCEISARGETWTIRDLGSSNGTYLNGKPVRAAPLNVGDTVRLGSTSFRLEPGGGTDAAGDATEPMVTRIIDLSADTASFLPEDRLDADALRKDYEKLRAAHEMNREIAIDLPLNDLLSRILGVIFEMIRADSGAILLADDSGNLEPRCQRTGTGKGFARIERPYSRTILREAFEKKCAVLASDAMVDDRFSGAESVLVQGIRSVMCVPLMGRSQVYGVIHLDTRGRAGAFTEKDLQILSSAARQAAMALENSRLLERVEQNARTKEQLKRFLPPAIVTEMMRDRIELDRDPRELTATVLFSDIRGFTALSERTETPGLIRLLNGYFDRMVEVVFDHGGVLDKFVGDALMAVWGTLTENTDAGAGRAVATARDMLVALADFNAGIHERTQLGIGIGVNTGPLVAGFMGSRSRRLEFTVIGDTVNVASRLCSLAGAGEILVGEDTYWEIGSPGNATPLEGIPIRGKERPVGIFRLEP